MQEVKTTQLTLSPQLWAHLLGVVEDPGEAPHRPYMTGEERAQSLRAILGSAKDPEAVWIFAYGSLIWNPDFSWTERRVARLSGWTRAFCLQTVRWRGTPAVPGLTMGLVPGQECWGVAYRMDPSTMPDDLDRLWRRELAAKPLNYDPRWVQVQLREGGEVQALAFTINEGGCSFVGVRPPEETADVIAKAVGVWGPCAEYLYETAKQLEASGLHDEEIWQLQKLVAERLLDHAAF